VLLVSAPHSITRKEAGIYFEEYKDMLVADAECVDCEAKYLAWIQRHFWFKSPYFRNPITRKPDDPPFTDLSFRSTFNDEPGPEDEPKWDIRVKRVRMPRKTTTPDSH
jgi:hypothetical protein